MLEKERIRGFDIISGIPILLFGIWILIETFQMPLTESYASVKNVWYVSPALFPMIIGVGFTSLSVLIIFHALKNRGLSQLKAILDKTRVNHGKNLRYFSLLVPLLTFVYLTLERIDFIQSSMFFLFFTILVFYLDDEAITRKLLALYSAIMMFFLVFTLSGFVNVMEKKFLYITDIVALILFIGFCAAGWIQTGHSALYRRKFRIALALSIGFPFFLAIVFRFMLRVPLPKEGGFTDLIYLFLSIIKKGV